MKDFGNSWKLIAYGGAVITSGAKEGVHTIVN